MLTGYLREVKVGSDSLEKCKAGHETARGCRGRKDGDGPLLEQQGARLGHGGDRQGRADRLSAALGGHEHLHAHRHVVLPQEKHVLPEVLILLALKRISELI